MLFIDRFNNQSVIIETTDGEKLRVEVIGATTEGATRLGFDGPKEVFKITRLNKNERAHYNLKKPDESQPSNKTSKFPSDHVGRRTDYYDED